jgi:SSS family solute:Na+ symporter
MTSLHPADYAILIGFLGLTLIVGVWMTRRASGGLEQYFLGGRSMPWWLLGIAGMTGWFDLTGTMIITSFLYMLGPQGLYIEFRGGAGLVLAFMLAYTAKWHRRSGCMTAAEWMTFRFGDDPWARVARLLTALTTILATIVMMAYLVRGASLFIGMVLPGPPMVWTAVIIALCAVYTTCSGFYGVVFTDFLQGSIIVIASVVVAVLAWRTIPDHAALAQAATLATGNAGWTNSIPSWNVSMPEGYKAYEMLIMVAGFYLLRTVLGGMSGGAEPRFFAARNDRECGLQCLVQLGSISFRWPLMLGFAVLGIFLVARLFPDQSAVAETSGLIRAAHPEVSEAFWHDLTNRIASAPAGTSPELVSQIQSKLGPDWRDKLGLVGFKGTINPERILPAVILHQLPTGIKGLLLVAMLAAMMSTLNGMVNTAGGMVVRDIYQKFLRQHARHRELMMASYAATLTIISVGFTIGVATSSINNLWSWIIMSLGAGMLGPMVLRLYWWRTNACGFAWGMMLGSAGSVLQRVFFQDLHEWWQLGVMVGLSFGGTIIGSLCSRPAAPETLREFFGKTRPFGFWGPVSSLWSKPELGQMRSEHFRDIVTVPFAMLLQVSLFLVLMQIVIKDYASLVWTVPTAAVSALGVFWFWWRHLPSATAGSSAELNHQRLK